MPMNIQVKNNILNLAELQEKLNRVVFDYVDTTQKWEKAQEHLQQLQSQMVVYFEQYISRNEGSLPSGNPYWVLFLDLASRLVYFNSLVKQNLMTDFDEAKRNEIANAYEMAAKIFPYKQSEENDEFLEEIEKSLRQITNSTRLIDKSSYPLSQCIESFHDYIKTLS
ncbi:MAG: hypothetical protein ACI33M_10500 [Lysinibacillus sp.]